MTESSVVLSDESVRRIASKIEPTRLVVSVTAIAKENANDSFLLTLKSPGGTESRFVIKRYIAHGTDPGARAQLEYEVLALLQANDVQVPEPVFLDRQGKILGTPTIVTRYIFGETMWTSPEGRQCAREMALTLVRIHSAPVDDKLQALLLDGNTDALWFVKPDGIPDYMVAHPDGQKIWDALPGLRSACQDVKPTLLHLDYWMGNVLWRDMRIVAVIDWEEAAYGDPAIDVGYCRMDMFLSRMGLEAADEFLTVYEAEMGRRVENLSLWEYAATPRCMHDPAWEEECREELRAFIDETRRRGGARCYDHAGN